VIHKPILLLLGFGWHWAKYLQLLKAEVFALDHNPILRLLGFAVHG